MIPGLDPPRNAKGPSSAPIRARPGALFLHMMQQAIRSAVLCQLTCSRKEIPPTLPLSQVCSSNEHPPLPQPTSPPPSWLSGVDRQEGGHTRPYYASGIAFHPGTIDFSN